jgi:hypothetical protein
MLLTISAIVYSFYRDYKRRQILQEGGVEFEEED